ncbi:uncharacterized protein LOC144553249 [Carex rostrata]
MQNIRSVCKICEAPVEDVLHVLFQCPHARATWFMSPLGLRTESLTEKPLLEVLLQLWKHLTNTQLAMFMSLGWHIWKARCSYIFQDKQCQPSSTLNDAISLIQQCHFKNGTWLNLGSDGKANSGEVRVQTDEGAQCCCWVDGSVGVTPASQQSGGAAYVLYKQGTLMRYELEYIAKPNSPFQTETQALLSAILAAQQLGVENCTFYSDCQLLIKTLEPTRNFRNIQAADWQAYQSLVRIAQLLLTHPGYCCQYISREENTQAHWLANRARTDRLSYVGFTMPMFSMG